jgi:hypothetical protein
MRDIKKERRNNVLALGGFCFIIRHNNQPIVGGSKKVSITESTCSRGKAYGRVLSLCSGLQIK